MKRNVSGYFFILRIAAGWHFLYEGIIKLLNPEWSSEAYLRGSYGFLSGLFQWLASDPAMINVVNFLNIWGMILIGTGLFLGLFIRISAVAGILLLLLYYFAYPPFGSSSLSVPTESHYWIINRNLIEAWILVIIFLLPARDFGLETFVRFFKHRMKKEPDQSSFYGTAGTKRRELLKGLISLPFFGGLVIGSASKSKNIEPDILSAATIALKKFDLSNLKGEVPKGKIGNLEISRLILGCNLISGWSHSRDLHYVSQLFRQYNTENKVFETLAICEQVGINTINMINPFFQILNKYKKITGSNMNSICQANVRENGNDPMVPIKESIDLGATTIYISGVAGDRLVREGKTDILAEAVEFIRSQGILAGVGSHSIQVPVACESAGLKPDYYYKSMHHDHYWSANPREFREEMSVDVERYLDHNKWHDNIWDLFPEQTVEFFKRSSVPLFGFKVLAGGAIKPEDGFRYAFENGADFICVGMFDFQVIEDANLVVEILHGELNRKRPWYT